MFLVRGGRRIFTAHLVCPTHMCGDRTRWLCRQTAALFTLISETCWLHGSLSEIEVRDRGPRSISHIANIGCNETWSDRVFTASAYWAVALLSEHWPDPILGACENCGQSIGLTVALPTVAFCMSPSL
eukprot:sb/3475392/